MATKSRLDKIINGLRNAVERYGRADFIKINQDLIVINYEGSTLWGTIILLTMIVSYPISIWAYYLLVVNPNNTLIFLWTIIIGGVVFNIYKIVRRSTILTINFQNNFLKIENSNKIFKRFFPVKEVEFKDIEKVELIDSRMETESYTTWKTLYLFDKNKDKILLAEFNGNFPDGTIASHVKLLFEVIIWSQKR